MTERTRSCAGSEVICTVNYLQIMQRIWSEVKTKGKMVFNLFLIGSARDYLNYVDQPSIALVQSEKTLVCFCRTIRCFLAVLRLKWQTVHLLSLNMQLSRQKNYFCTYIPTYVCIQTQGRYEVIPKRKAPLDKIQVSVNHSTQKMYHETVMRWATKPWEQLKVLAE